MHDITYVEYVLLDQGMKNYGNEKVKEDRGDVLGTVFVVVDRLRLVLRI